MYLHKNNTDDIIYYIKVQFVNPNSFPYHNNLNLITINFSLILYMYNVYVCVDNWNTRFGIND